MEEVSNLEKLAEDNIRTHHVYPATFKKPVCVFMVGLPASGKSRLAKHISEHLSLTKFSEEDLTKLFAPNATITEREVVKVFQLAEETIKHLLRMGKGIVYDANMKTKEQRQMLKSAIEQSGGKAMLIHCATSKEVCYGRIQKRNLAITRGDLQGIILDKDYFEYEVATTIPPSGEEGAIIYDTSQGEDKTVEVVDKIQSTIQVLEKQ